MVSHKLSELSFTDHSLISVEMNFTKTDQDVDLGRMPTKATMNQIRTAAVSEETQAKMVAADYNISKQAKDLY